MDEPLDRLEFHLTTSCDQKCVFCNEGSLMRAYPNRSVSYENAVKTLIRKRRDGCTHVTFTGGEPTAHPRLIDILRAAKRLRYWTSITTDGFRLSDFDYAKEIFPFLDEICISIHGDGPKTHDYLAGLDGSFNRLMTAFSHIKRLKSDRLDFPPYIRTNTVVTRTNVKSVLATVKIVAATGFVRDCMVSNMGAVGEAHRNFKEFAPRLKDIQRLVPALVKLCAQAGMRLRFYRVPLCLLGDRRRSSDSQDRVKIRSGRVGEGVGLLEVVRRPPKMDGIAFYPPKCSTCDLRDLHCPGISRIYYKHFGDKELTPIVSPE